MSDYLLPTNNELTILEIQRLFAIKTRMEWIPSNFPKPEVEYKWECGLREDMRHIYNCELINNKQKPRHDYDKLYTGNIAEQIEVFRKFEINLERRKIVANSASAEGVLATGSAHARPSARPPIDTSGNFPAHVSPESPSNISPNSLEVISEVIHVCGSNKNLKKPKNQ